MDDDNFKSISDSFLLWLRQAGIHLNPKASLVDLRGEGRGRGLGSFSHYFQRFGLFS
jgi:hypothetical protein